MAERHILKTIQVFSLYIIFHKSAIFCYYWLRDDVSLCQFIKISQNIQNIFNTFFLRDNTKKIHPTLQAATLFVTTATTKNLAKCFGCMKVSSRNVY